MLSSSKVIKQVLSELDAFPITASNKDRFNKEINPVTEQQVCLEEQNILKKARQEAERIIQESKSRIAQIEKEAYENAYIQGEQNAQKQVQKEAEAIYASAREVLRQAEEIRANIYRETEEELISVAVNIAERLIFRQLDLMPDTIVDIASAACLQAREAKQIVIYVEPDKVDILKARQQEIYAKLFAADRLYIIADPGIKSGCRIETEQGHIDASISTMLQQVESILKDSNQ